MTVMAVTYNDNESGRLWEALWCREGERYLKKLCAPGVFVPPVEFPTEAAFWSAFEAERTQFKGYTTASAPSPQSATKLVERQFTDPIAQDAVTLVMAGEEPSLWDGTVGVRHDGCGRLADVSPQLDAFYCHGCGRNGRVNGGWVIDVMAGRA